MTTTDQRTHHSLSEVAGMLGVTERQLYWRTRYRRHDGTAPIPSEKVGGRVMIPAWFVAQLRGGLPQNAEPCDEISGTAHVYVTGNVSAAPTTDSKEEN